MNESPEVLDRLRALQVAEQAITDANRAHREAVRPLYEERDRLAAALAELTTYRLPRRVNRTETQRKLERCPRCRGRLDEAA